MTEDNKLKVVQTSMEVKKERGEISDFKIKVEDGVINVYVIPKASLQHIECDFIISPTGTSFQ